MTRILAAFAGMLLAAGIGSQQARAQADQNPAENFKQYSLDLSVPESPAFAILGVSPQSVIHPTSIRELAGTLVNGMGSGGQLQAGIALDAAPFLLVAGNDLTLSDYRNSKLTRLLANTQLSIATAKADNEQTGKGTKAGLGLHMKLYDRGDPRLSNDLSDCYKSGSDTVFKSLPISPTLPADRREAIVKEREKMLTEAFSACRKTAREKLWNRTSWLVGLAGAWTNEGSASDGMRSGGSAAWTTFAYGFEGIRPLEQYAQLLVHGRLHDDEVVASKATSAGFLKRDSAVLGTRFRLGSESGVFLVEASFAKGRLENGQSEDTRRVAVGGEIRISKDIWLVGSIGGEGGFADGTRRQFVLGGLKFGSASESQFGSK